MMHKNKLESTHISYIYNRQIKKKGGKIWKGISANSGLDLAILVNLASLTLKQVQILGLFCALYVL